VHSKDKRLQFLVNAVATSVVQFISKGYKCCNGALGPSLVSLNTNKLRLVFSYCRPAWPASAPPRARPSPPPPVAAPSAMGDAL
jgi:hypothetical protein